MIPWTAAHLGPSVCWSSQVRLPFGCPSSGGSSDKETDTSLCRRVFALNHWRSPWFPWEPGVFSWECQWDKVSGNSFSSVKDSRDPCPPSLSLWQLIASVFPNPRFSWKVGTLGVVPGDQFIFTLKSVPEVSVWLVYPPISRQAVSSCPWCSLSSALWGTSGPAPWNCPSAASAGLRSRQCHQGSLPHRRPACSCGLLWS